MVISDLFVKQPCEDSKMDSTVESSTQIEESIKEIVAYATDRRVPVAAVAEHVVSNHALLRDWSLDCRDKRNGIRLELARTAVYKIWKRLSEAAVYSDEERSSFFVDMHIRKARIKMLRIMRVIDNGSFMGEKSYAAMAKCNRQNGQLKHRLRVLLLFYRPPVRHIRYVEPGSDRHTTVQYEP